MASHTTPATGAKSFQSAVGDTWARLHHHAWRRTPGFELLMLGLRLFAAAVLPGRSHRQGAAAMDAEAVEELEEVVWPAPLTIKSTKPAPGDWLFPSFFLCMAVAALPLIGLHWTTPQGMATWRAFADALVFSLPVIVPLPFLLVGCLGMLALQPASRTPAALGFLGGAMLIGLAGMHALIISQ
jgi:hypothetical protein